MEFTIRDAELSDIPSCLDMGQEYWIASGLQNNVCRFSYTLASRNLELFVLDKSKEFLVAVAESENPLKSAVGVYMGVYSQVTSYPVALHETAWIIRPSAHGNGIGWALVKEMERRAFEHGVCVFNLYGMHNLSEDIISKYKSNGYFPERIMFSKRTNQAGE